MTRQAIAGRVLFGVYLYSLSGIVRCDPPLLGIWRSIAPLL